MESAEYNFDVKYIPHKTDKIIPKTRFHFLTADISRPKKAITLCVKMHRLKQHGTSAI